MSKQFWVGLGVGVAVTAVLAPSLAMGAVRPSATPAITKVCVAKSTGLVRVATKCKSTERLTTLGTQGPRGLQGVRGLAGSVGIDGKPGPNGPTGLQGPSGADGVPGPAGPAGATGATGPAGPQGVMGFTQIYTWNAVTGPNGDVTGSTNLPPGTQITVLGASITGDFSACVNGFGRIRERFAAGIALADWYSISSPVNGLAPSYVLNGSTTLDQSTPLEASIQCENAQGFPVVPPPTVTFTLQFGVRTLSTYN